MRDCGSEPRCESPIRAGEPQLNTSRYPWLAVGSCRVRDTLCRRGSERVPRNCVIVSADWGRDVSKRAVYVGRCEPS